MEADDRTFGVSYSREGLEALRKLVMDKLKVFMGDFTDDVLVEYVIVMLKNGRSKNEAKTELNVFLGDDSDSFISWLWDHLGSNLTLYTQPPELHLDGEPKANYVDREQIQGIKTTNESKKRSYKEYEVQKSLISSENVEKNESSSPKKSKKDNVYTLAESHTRVDRAKKFRSPELSIHKNGERERNDARRTRKERRVSRTNFSASRRILQSAVRDAVSTSKPVNSTAKPSVKRLRSVVSTSIEDSSIKKHPQKVQKTMGLPTDMSAAVKFAPDAVEVVTKARSSQNVFDRLSNAAIASDVINHHGEYRDDIEDNDDVYEKGNFLPGFNNQEDDSLLQHGNASFDDNIIEALDFGYVNESYDDVDVMDRRGTVMSRSGPSSENWVHNSEFRYEDDNFGGRRLLRPRKELDHSTAVPNKSFNIAASTNVYPWKPPQQPEVRDVSEMDDIMIRAKSEKTLSKEKMSSLVISNGNAKLDVGPKHDPGQNVSQVGLGSTCLPTEDADSRTVFVSNVHFAATKESLSRHFNMFGEVLKVNILIDPSTGQPKGSAYIEFMRKEAAERALSLSGTSFLSRILRIVMKKGTTPVEAPVAWPRPSFGRIPFGRGNPSSYRARIPIKPGARSFQWKRDSNLTPASNQGFNNIGSAPTPRSLTYIRTKPNTNVTPSNA